MLLVRYNIKVALIAVVVCMLWSSSSSAEWYVAVDQTKLEWHVNFANVQENYDIDPMRLRVGYAKDNYSLEFHWYGSATEEEPDPFVTEVNMISGVENAYGIYAKAASSKQFGPYIMMGMMMVNTEYGGLTSAVTDYADFLSFSMGAGVHYKLLDDLAITIDYVEMQGDVNYPTYTIQTGGAVDAQLKGWSLGLKYHF